MRSKFERCGIEGVQRFAAVDGAHTIIPLNWSDSPGAYGCLRSHLEIIEEARKNGVRATGGLRGDAQPPSPFKLEKQSSLVALYACQPDQKTYEQHLPDAEAGKHGLLTWTVCQLLYQAGSPLSPFESVSFVTPVPSGRIENTSLTTSESLGSGSVRLLSTSSV